ncbi:peptidase M50 [Clostridium carboxidivorans P7]|uniref:Peptidase M50 n=1 Tax=Clostridium carboxidivorans P7 TaxID=536227 RepID=C6PYM3_9CLOT|nr:peptidase M50 [Clostridium carboxidivorans P7]
MIRVNKYFIPYVIFLIIVGYKGNLIYAFFIVIIHEAVHYLTAKHYNFSGFDIELIAFGASIKFKELDDASPKEDLIISLSGPLSNFVLAAILYYINTIVHCDEIYMLFAGNIAIGIFNLIPAFPLDGGRILRDILYFKFSYKKANRIMINISTVIGAFLMFFYIVLFLKDLIILILES